MKMMMRGWVLVVQSGKYRCQKRPVPFRAAPICISVRSVCVETYRSKQVSSIDEFKHDRCV
jgi:hypothetical protein